MMQQRDMLWQQGRNNNGGNSGGGRPMELHLTVAARLLPKHDFLSKGDPLCRVSTKGSVGKDDGRWHVLDKTEGVVGIVAFLFVSPLCLDCSFFFRYFVGKDDGR
jgi:hypothetical protein